MSSEPRSSPTSSFLSPSGSAYRFSVLCVAALGLSRFNGTVTSGSAGIKVKTFLWSILPRFLLHLATPTTGLNTSNFLTQSSQGSTVAATDNEGNGAGSGSSSAGKHCPSKKHSRHKHSKTSRLVQQPVDPQSGNAPHNYFL